MIPFSTAASTRRNGKPPSCEPCRTQKVRCDHALPVCGRCYSRGIAKDCTYHPAPLTKQAGAQGSSHDLHHEPASPLVFTNYKALFDENRSLLQGLLLDETSILSDDPAVPRAEDILSGSKILLFLQSSSVFIQLVDFYYQQSQVPILPHIMARSICSSAHNVLGASSVTDPLSQGVQVVANRICFQSCRKLTIGEKMTMQNYCSQFTGNSLRWESVGNIFAIAGICLMSLEDADPLLLDDNGNLWAKTTLAHQLIDACDKCATLCIHSSQAASEVSAAFLCNNIQLLTMVLGDGNQRVWDRLTELSGLVYSGELHLDRNTHPIFLRQWRRRIFAAAFFIDKAVSTFIGRPPLINWRYCDMTPPQDVSDEDLVSLEGRSAEPQWNQHGWRIPSRLSPCSFIRLRFMISALRSEILEVCMGMNSSDVEQRARELLRRVVAFPEKVPSYMRFDTVAESQNPQGMTNHDRMVLLAHLDMKYNSFLLQRSILKRTNTGLRALLQSCEEILTAISKICKEYENISALKNDFSWAVLFYGLPCAGLIAFELVKGPPHHGLSRLIPLLSVFASSLRWIAPLNYGNYTICRQAEFQLSRILDAAIERQFTSEDPVHFANQLAVADSSALQFLPLDSLDFLDPAVLSNQQEEFSSIDIF
ncbi:C6 transcription factor [Penicillium riverlandense]|uniref:C6 transcription factor n=1 Tax=Penicillium riverlandense TaxID=1903569 RepID=UPI0025466704|nr:C6 transcription factor [Penicillium riverlandense]KAJ5812452.1 C6 transcription factor [Penicillium riverlandense]